MLERHDKSPEGAFVSTVTLTRVYIYNLSQKFLTSSQVNFSFGEVECDEFNHEHSRKQIMVHYTENAQLLLIYKLYSLYLFSIIESQNLWDWKIPPRSSPSFDENHRKYIYYVTEKAYIQANDWIDMVYFLYSEKSLKEKGI